MLLIFRYLLICNYMNGVIVNILWGKNDKFILNFRVK